MAGLRRCAGTLICALLAVSGLTLGCGSLPMVKKTYLDSGPKGQVASGSVRSKVFLNGVPSPVFFNDGDSFRVLDGKYKDSRARLAGYNTLESYGNVHKWGGWTFEELYVNAKQGTLNARNGPCWDNKTHRPKPGCTKAWHCTSELKKDYYGRYLWSCKDLALDQIRRGFAHVMSVKGPGISVLVAAQKEAIAKKVGMWSRGVPEFIITSIHSFDEPYSKEKGSAYNRLVSTGDGHSQKWLHLTAYPECTIVCRREVQEPDKIRDAFPALRTEAEVASMLKDYDDNQLFKIVRRFAEVGEVYFTSDKAHKAPFKAVFTRYRDTGKFGKLKKGSCMRYAAFTRRYGSSAASCLH
jgi:hypothetical protein